MKLHMIIVVTFILSSLVRNLLYTNLLKLASSIKVFLLLPVYLTIYGKHVPYFYRVTINCRLYYDYEWSKTRWSFSDEVLDSNLQSCHWQLSSFPVVTISPMIITCNFVRFAANDVKGRQVATRNRASCPWQQHKLNVKPGHQTFVTPYSTDNCGKPPPPHF